MKRCPSCQRTYTDETLRFCLEDGTTLLSGAATSAPSDPMAATLLDSSSSQNTGSDRSARTEVFHSPPTSGNQTPQTRSWGTPNASPSAAGDSWGAVRRPSGQQQQQSAPFVSAAHEAAEKRRSWPAVTSLIIGIVTWLMLVITFVGAGVKVRDEFVGFSFLAGLFLSVFGIVFGAVAFGIAFRSPERYSGKGIALLGFFMSLLPTLFLLLLVAIGVAITL
ncbi:MAG: hypothetical protein WCF57_19860 [Pyrinomonadaceae bacterium]